MVYFSGITFDNSISQFGDYFDNDEYQYVGDSYEKYNVWVAKDFNWHLLADLNKHPLEFASEIDATNFCKTHGMTIVSDSDIVKGVTESNSNKYAVPRRVPVLEHDMTFLSQDQKTIDERCQAVPTEFGKDFVAKLLAAKNGGEQSKIMQDALSNKLETKELLALQTCSVASGIIRAIYVNPGFKDIKEKSYHTTLANLVQFYPIE